MGVRENIIRLRELTGLTQEQLADIAGVSRAAVSLWEIGNSTPRMGAVQALADHFHIRKANIIEDGGMDGIAVSVSGRLYEVEYDSSLLSDDERELVGCYRSTDQRGREVIMAVARSQLGMEGTAPARVIGV